MSTTHHPGDDEILEILDPDGQVIGTMTRGEAEAAGHHTANVLMFIFTPAGQVWAQLRPLTKKHFPGLWDISACGGIVVGEQPLESAHRELSEEMGLDTELRHVETFLNQFADASGTVYRRLSHLYIGTSDAEPRANDDVDEFRAWDIAELEAEVEAKPEAYVPSFAIELAKAVAAYRSRA